MYNVVCFFVCVGSEFDACYRTMGLPLTPRNDDKEVIDERSVSLVDLFRMVRFFSPRNMLSGNVVSG